MRMKPISFYKKLTRIDMCGDCKNINHKHAIGKGRIKWMKCKKRNLFVRPTHHACDMYVFNSVFEMIDY